MTGDQPDVGPDFGTDLSKNWGLVTLVGIALVLSFSWSLRGPLPTWGDETFTLRVAAESWSDFWREITLDVHPPLYFALCKLAAGNESGRFISPPNVRALSYVLYALSMWLIFTLLRRRVAGMEALFYPMLLIVSSAHLALFSPMLRYYALSAIGVTCSTLLLLPETGYKASFQQKPLLPDYVWYGLSLFVAFASSYLTAVVLPAHLIYLLSRPRKESKPFLAAIGIVLLLSLPLIWLLAIQARNGHGLSNAGLTALVTGSIARLLFALYSFAIGESLRPWDWYATIPALIALVILAIPVCKLRRVQPGSLLLLTFSISLPLGAVVLALTGVGTEFSASRLMFLAPVFLILLGISASTYPPVRAKYSRIALLLLAAINLYSTVLYGTGESAIQSTYIIPWNRISTKVAENIRDGTLLLYDDDTLMYWLTGSQSPADSINLNSLDDLSRLDGYGRVIIVYSPRDITATGIAGSVIDRLDTDYKWMENWSYAVEDEQSVRLKSMLLRRSIEPVKKALRVYDSAG
jgi:hypothetical protein